MAADNGGSQGPDEPRARLTIIVDGANVVGSRPDGWWHDRVGAAVRLYDGLLRLAARDVTGVGDDAAEVVLVLEGAARGAMSRVAARASEAEGGHSPAPNDSREAQGGSSAAGSGAGGPAARVRVVSAPGSGDDEIVRLVRSLPGRRVVVTADRELRRRCEAAGAEVTSPSWLYGLL
jgi:hypothetical protein